MVSLPRIIDVRDDLRRAQRASENDVDDDISDVLSQLERYSDPDRRHQKSLLDTAENTLLRLQEQETSEKAIQRFQAARNRIEIFRDAISNADTERVVVDYEIRNPNTGSQTRVERLQGDPGEARISVVNLGEPAEGSIRVSLYDERGTALQEATGTIELDSDGMAVTGEKTQIAGEQFVDRLVSENHQKPPEPVEHNCGADDDGYSKEHRQSGKLSPEFH
jgi:hypothetical protein